MVSGGIGADGQILSSVEVWDPARQAWSDAAGLPIPLYGQSAVLLGSGQVLTAGGTWISHWGPIPWAWTWTPATDTWQVAGHVTPNGPADLSGWSTQVTLVATPGNGALVLTPRQLMRWEPVVEDPRSAPPLWHAQPSAARLADGRILWVGKPESHHGAPPLVARIWDPVRRTWSDAGGGPATRTWMHASTRQLPSGRVIHVGIDAESRLICEDWTASTNLWTPCGSARVREAASGRVRLGLMPDGRAFAIATDEDVFVFDEARGEWTAWKPRWNSDGMALGAPIRSDGPLLSIRDPATGGWIALDDEEAGRHWQDSMRGQTSLLWDPRSRQWAYIFGGHGMGSDARWLPDGCALSVHPLAVFNPVDGKVRRVVDPGLGMEAGTAEMVVLPDGGVVVAGVPEGAKDIGGGFFQGKASCAGLESKAGNEGYFSGGLAADRPAAAPPGATPAASSASSAATEWKARAMRLLPGQNVLVMLALGALTGYVVLKTRSGPRRVLIGGTVLSVGMAVAWWQGRQPGSVDATPCSMVGVWSSRQGQQMRRIELKDDGSYAMEASAMGGDRRTRYTGQWAVQGDRMVWRHDEVKGTPDINPMEREGATRFTLTESNGSRTRYELIRAVPSLHCKP